MITDTNECFTRVNRDINGNPRYVVHYSDIADTYEEALQIARTIGGKKYRNHSYGGGIVFQSYNIDATAEQLNRAIKLHNATKRNEVL